MLNSALVRQFGVLEDNALVDAYLHGVDDAFEVLMKRYQGKLVNYVNGIVHDYDRSIDLCQEAFIKVFKNASRYKGKYQFSTWLYRIATNLAIDELRRRRRRAKFSFFPVADTAQTEETSIPIPDTRHCPEQAFETKEKAECLELAIGSLSEKYRLAFILKEVQGLSYEESAQVLNISVGTVKSRIHRAKLLLREKLAGSL